MPGGHFYLLASLPVLDELGATPPLRAAAFLERVQAPQAHAAARAVFLADDLALRADWQAVRGVVPACAVLTPEQVTGDGALPPELLPRGQRGGRARPAADELWAAYVRWAYRLAREIGNPLLERWVVTETALRNALVVQRARALQVEAERWLVAEDVGAHGAAEVARAVVVWSGAADPLAGLAALLRWRWDWVGRCEPWFTFADDEVTAYALRLALMHRWTRVHGGGERREAA